MNHTKAGRAKSRREFYEVAWLDAFMRTLDPRPCGECDYCRGVRGSTTTLRLVPLVYQTIGQHGDSA